MVQGPVTLERLEQLKKAEPAIYFHIEEIFQSGTYTKQEHSLIRMLIELGNFQLEAACSWFEYDLLRAPYEVGYLESVILQWDQLPPSERPAISREVVEERLLNLKESLSQKESAVESARKEGVFWSIVPLPEFFDLPEEERADKSCYPFLPNLMQEAYMQMKTPRQQQPGLIVRWIGNIKRLRFSVSETGGEVEIERHEPTESDREL